MEKINQAFARAPSKDVRDSVSAGLSDPGVSIGLHSRRSGGKNRNTVTETLRKSVFQSSQSGSTD